MSRLLFMGLMCVVSLGSSQDLLAAGKFNQRLSIGDPAPEWADLPGTDGKRHSLRDLHESKAVVVVFLCNHCPIAQAYEERLKALTDAYRDRKVAVVAISVSRVPADDLEHMTTRAREQKFNFDYLTDPSQEIGRRFGATCTPHLFVLNAQRKVAYMGAFDDHWQDVALVEEPYVRLALDAILDDKAPEITESRQVGCGIEYTPKAKE